jgi:hypothetical protein
MDLIFEVDAIWKEVQKSRGTADYVGDYFCLEHMSSRVLCSKYYRHGYFVCVRTICQMEVVRGQSSPVPSSR